MSDSSPENTIRHDTGERHAGKYQNDNFLHHVVLGRFLDTVARQIEPYQKSRVLDFGCSEAFFWSEMLKRGIEMENLTGIDLREDALVIATENFPDHTFLRENILEYDQVAGYDLVVASQVLEHLPSPEMFVTKLLTLVKPKIQPTLLVILVWQCSL